MPFVGNLFDFLATIDLQQYHYDFVNKLGVTTVDHVTYVQVDDVLKIGMTPPEWRRLQASMKKARKGKLSSVKDKLKGGSKQQKPTIVRVNAKDGAPTGGHIIPSTAIQITDRELGRGEFGKVMQGIWTNDSGQKIQVAVKCLTLEKFAEKSTQDFIKEAAIMHSLKHEHLVKLFGVVLDMDSSLVLVTEFAPLRSLSENLKQPALRISFPIHLLLEFVQQIADAMKYLHYSNIIHRDLATRNILLFVDDQGSKLVKISDFGLSRRLICEENYTSEMRPNLKLPLAWMPVEALTKLTFTKASDVWSFGVTMWEMFSYGCQPWATRSGEEILRAIDRPNLQRLSKPEACPRQVYELFLKCWRHEPDSRPTFAEICEELPKMKPLQVRAIANYQGSREGELSYRAEDVITVLDTNDDTGVWRGVTTDGHIGVFHRSNTTVVGGSGGTKLKRWKSGSKGSNKAENRKRSESPKTPKKSPSKLTSLDIGAPSEYKHVFHVGYDGRIKGDPTFGGDYRSLPPNSSPSKSDQWSSTSSTSSRSPMSTPQRSPTTTPSKSPTFPSVSIQPRTHILTNDPPVTTSSQPDIRAGVPVPGPRVRLAEDEAWDLEGSSCSLTGDERSIDDGANFGATAATPDDELSSLDFGSLLDDVMTAWDATRTSVGIDHPTSDSTTPQEDTNGDASGRSTPSSINDDAASISASSHSQGIIMVGKREGATVLESSSPDEGSLDSLPPLHNAITKDMPSNPVKTYRRNNSSASVSSYQSSSHSLPRDKELVYEAEDEIRYRSASGASADNEYIDSYADDDIDDVLDVSEHGGLNGGVSFGANVDVNGNGHISHEDHIDAILEGAEYADSGVPEEIRSELETTSASSSYSSRVNSQISKASTDSDDDRPLRINTNINHRESLSSNDANEQLGGSSPTTKPRSPKSPSSRSPRKPKCAPPPRPKLGPPPAPAPRPKGPPPPAPQKMQGSPRSSIDYANHGSKSSDDEIYSVSALRQKFDFARRGSNESSERRGSGDGPMRVGRSGSQRETINAQVSVGRSSSISSYDSGRDEPEVKLSERTLENLERSLPRRTRRSVGEGKHKPRRTSDEESDRSSMASSRASEGESSADEGAAKTSYQSAACPLPDLPEDQTNNLSSATHHPFPNLPPPRQSHHHYDNIAPHSPQSRPRLVRQSNSSEWSPHGQALLEPSDDVLKRSQSLDDGLEVRSNRLSFTTKSQSIDILDTEGSHLATSPEQIRELLNIRRDKPDMPDRTPPPIPKRLTNMQSELIGVDNNNSRMKRDHSQDYEFMKPQTNLSLNLSPGNNLRHHQDSDSGVDSPQQDHSHLGHDRLNQSFDGYIRMGSMSSARHDLEIGSGNFTRSQSARTINWEPASDISSSQKHRWEDITTVARSKFNEKTPVGRRSSEKLTRKSRSVEDLLADGGLQKAESLRDVLARTYVPPSDNPSKDDQKNIYLVPRSWKSHQSNESTLTPPSDVSIVAHPSAPSPKASSPLEQTLPPPPSITGHIVNSANEPGYIDMKSQSGIYRTPPCITSRTIPEEEEPVSPKSPTDSCVSFSDTIHEFDESTPMEEQSINSPQYSSSAQNFNPEKRNLLYDVPPSIKSRRSPSKEMHTIPSPVRSPKTEPSSGLTKSLSQDVPLPKKTRQVKFAGSHSSDDDGEGVSDASVEISQSTKARELKDQLPTQIPVKTCFDALRDANWNMQTAKKHLLIRYLAQKMSVEENACESALKQCNWDVDEAVEVLNDAPELSVSL